MKTFSKILLLFLSLSSVLSNLRTLEDLKVTKKTILVKPNQIFTIKLYTNSSTGYSWQMENENSSAFTFIQREREVTKEDLALDKMKHSIRPNVSYSFKAGATS